MADSIYTFDPVAANNTALDTIPYGPNQLYHNKIDDLFRAVAAKLAQFADDLGAANTVGGTGDAITVTLASGITAYATAQLFRFIAGAANTGAATMNVNSIGAKAIRKISGGTDVALSAGDIAAGETYLVIYRASANSAAGAWLLIGGAGVSAASTSAAGIVELLTSTEQLTGTDATRASTADSIAALWEKGSDEASAGTVSFGEGGYFHVTGTTTITDLDFDTAKDGRAVDVVFDGVLTLTHNGTTLQLPGGASITTAAGDRARFVQDNSDNVICLWYQRAGSLSTGITLGTAVASTSGTSIDFTGIPAWAKRVTINFDGMSVSGTSNILFQLGDSGGIETSGYLGAGTNLGNAQVVAATNYTNGFGVPFGSGANIFYGSVVFTLLSASTNTWIAAGNYGLSNVAYGGTLGGSKSLSATLDRVRITTVGGTDTFDAGTVNISYE